ncbi:MAG TPA: FAD-binding oxidoreductase [Rhizomicrobium sp.]|jgi:alkyldihydroxyacetonephosphate synthase|nr:FAD-binding oxidoreductase [Rhizomicrobium sp.]
MTIDRTKLRWNGWGWSGQAEDFSARTDVWAWLASELGMPSLLATPARSLDDVQLPPSRLAPADRHILTRLLGAEALRDDKLQRAFHARGRGYQDLLRLRAGDLADAPDAVIYPRSNQEVLTLLAFASERSIALIPYGGGTSVVGGVTPRRFAHNGVLTIDLSEMDRVESIDPESLRASAQAGIFGPALEQTLSARGFTLGHFPQSFEFSTLGGWIAHRGAGQLSNRYGRPEDWLVAAEIATPRGILRDRDFPASATGPRLTDFAIGSEGIFGVITRAAVRLHRAPEVTTGRAYLFRDFASGAAAIRDGVQSGVGAAMLRLSDIEETRFQRALSRLGRGASILHQASAAVLNSLRYGRPCLLLAEFEGSRGSVQSSKRAFGGIARHHGALPLGSAPVRRWQQSRFGGPYLRDPMLDRGLGVDTLETATSWSNLHTLYEAVRTALEQAIAATVPRPFARGIVMCHVSHSYVDGASLYFTYIFPRMLGDELGQWQSIKRAVSEAIITNGGTISHHHGVGEDHLPWIVQEKGQLGLEVMRTIKRTLDPKGILNPGKLIPV